MFVYTRLHSYINGTPDASADHPAPSSRVTTTVTVTPRYHQPNLVNCYELRTIRTLLHYYA